MAVPADFTFADASITSTGGNISFAADVKENLFVQTHSGQCSISDLSAKNVSAHSTSGEVALWKVIANEKIQIRSKSGSVLLKESDAGALIIETASGNTDVPPSTEGGICNYHCQR